MMNTMRKLKIELHDFFVCKHIVQSFHKPRSQKEFNPVVILKNIDKRLHQINQKLPIFFIQNLRKFHKRLNYNSH